VKNGFLDMFIVSNKESGNARRKRKRFQTHRHTTVVILLCNSTGYTHATFLIVLIKTGKVKDNFNVLLLRCFYSRSVS